MTKKDFTDPDNLPEMIGPYKVESFLDRGGMSYVFLGHDPKADVSEKVILKVLQPEFTEDKRMNERFINEAKILGSVYHPNIPKIYKVDKWENGIYIAMEYFKGISLRSFIFHQSFSLKRALEIILKIGYALYHLHSHGVVHRDLKPENVIITEDGEVKVIDFSLSQLIPEDKFEHILEDRYRGGTPFYMTPEQRDNPRLVTKATDIYALGIIAFELILGKSTYGVIQTFLLPQGLRQIIEKAIQELPELRYDDVFDFITAISGYLKKLEAGTEEREVADSGPVKDLLDHIQSVFLPKKAPKWPQIEIGIAYEAGMAINALYLDFFHLEGSKYAIVMAEPLKTGVTSLFHTFGLRGMVRLEAIGKDGFSKEMLQRMSKALYNDPTDQKFGMSTIVLDLKKNKVVFSSCKFSNLWKITGDEVIECGTPGNPALGHYSKAGFHEDETDWNKGDVLVLYSHPIEIERRPERLKAVKGARGLGVEEMTQKLLVELSHLSPASKQKGSALITIQLKR